MNAPALPLRDGSVTIAALADLYVQQYAGRDRAMTQRLAWWVARLGAKRLDEVCDDDVHLALEELAARPPRYYAGKDADGRPIFKAKRQQLSGATLNRYSSALASVLTFAIHRRIAPKGFDHPVHRVKLRPESPGQTRFLSDDERARLLEACKASKWPRLYLLVLLGLTTGARKGELLGLRWADVDFERQVMHVGRTKNGDPKVLPLVPSVIEQMQRFRAAPGALVFPSRLNPAKPMTIELRWAQALREAKVKAFRFHDLRHSCASYLAQNGASLLEIADLLGHRQISMTHRYSHLATSHRAALVGRVMGDLR